VIIIGILIFNIIIAFFIQDIVNVTGIKSLIFIKWIVLFVSGVYVYKLLKPKQPQQNEIKKTITSMEKEIINKKKLKSKSDLIIEKYKKRGE
jgi:hypothetical protein